MRPTRVTGLVLLWLLTNATWAFSQEKADEHFAGTGARPTTKLLTEENAPSPIWQAEGYGKTEKDAVNDALDQVAMAMKAGDYLSQHGVRDWLPGVEDLRPLVKSSKIEQANFEEAGLGNMIHATLKVELSPQTVQKFQKAAREQRAGGRMLNLGKGLGMLVALLVALGGYFRLEEATKGYYTTWLRLTAIGFIGTAATSLWFLA